MALILFLFIFQIKLINFWEESKRLRQNLILMMRTRLQNSM